VKKQERTRQNLYDLNFEHHIEEKFIFNTMIEICETTNQAGLERFCSDQDFLDVTLRLNIERFPRMLCGLDSVLHTVQPAMNSLLTKTKSW